MEKERNGQLFGEYSFNLGGEILHLPHLSYTGSARAFYLPLFSCFTIFISFHVLSTFRFMACFKRELEGGFLLIHLIHYYH